MRVAPFAALLALSACASVRPAPSLDGTRWTVAAIAGEPTGGGPQFFMTFDKGRIGGKFGCNTFGGTASVVRDRLVTTGLFITEMACVNAFDTGPDPMRFESRGTQILSLPMRIGREDDRHLRLVSAEGTIDLLR
jgi:heat shock protein HslJ